MYLELSVGLDSGLTFFFIIFSSQAEMRTANVPFNVSFNTFMLRLK